MDVECVNAAPAPRAFFKHVGRARAQTYVQWSWFGYSALTQATQVRVPVAEIRGDMMTSHVLSVRVYQLGFVAAAALQKVACAMLYSRPSQVSAHARDDVAARRNAQRAIRAGKGL